MNTDKSQALKHYVARLTHASPHLTINQLQQLSNEAANRLIRKNCQSLIRGKLRMQLHTLHVVA